jgi:hypothetical protein
MLGVILTMVLILALLGVLRGGPIAGIGATTQAVE